MTRIICLALLAILLSLVAGCAPTRLPVTVIDEALPTPEEENRLGNALSTLLVQFLGGHYPDQSLENYVNRIARPLATANDHNQLKVKIADDPMSLSFTFPGGFVVVTSGLLQTLDNEPQLAALLAWEAAQLQTGHVHEHLRSLILGRAVLMQDVRPGEPGFSQRLALVQELTEVLLHKNYPITTSGKEHHVAIDLLVKAGYPPDSFFELNELWRRQAQETPQVSRIDYLSGQGLQSLRNYIAATYPDSRADGNIDSSVFVVNMEGLRQAAPAYALYHQARQAEAMDDQSTAQQLYHQAIRQQPRNLLLTALGMAYLRGEDLIPARRYLRQATTEDANYYRSRQGLGYIHLQRSEWSAAVAELEMSLSLLPTVEGVFLLAEVEQRRGNNARARTLYQHLQEVTPRSALGRAAADRLRQLPR